MTGTAAPGRAGSVRDLDAREQGALLLGRDGLPEQTTDARGTEGDARPGRRLRLAVHDAHGGPPAGPAQDERRRPVGAGQGQPCSWPFSKRRLASLRSA